jgi:hypothetical protein
LKDNNSIIDLNFHNGTENTGQLKSSKKPSKYEKINERFDDLVGRMDASQRSQASLHQILNFLVLQVQDLKRQLGCNK